MSEPRRGRLVATLDCGATVSAAPEHTAVILDVERRHLSERERWIADLRAQGVKAAHPDDGWVSRPPQEECVHLEYPDFNDGLGVGDLLALGRPRGRTRIVRVTRIEDTSSMFGLRHYYFESPGARRLRWWDAGGRFHG